MARGRFISNDVIADKEIHNLSSDTSRLAYIFLITLADCEGRVVGDPVYLASLLFPRRREVTPEMITGFIIEWIKAGFIIWYFNEDGEKAIQLVNWEKHQKGLRKDREAPSEFDDPESCELVKFDETVKDNEKNKNKFKLNGKSVQNLDLGTDKIGSSELMDCFVQETGIIPPSEHLQPKQAMDWEREVRAWEVNGITKDQVAEAIAILHEKDMTIGWPGSLTKTINSEMAKRKLNSKDAPDKLFKASDGNWYNAKGEIVDEPITAA